MNNKSKVQILVIGFIFTLLMIFAAPSLLASLQKCHGQCARGNYECFKKCQKAEFCPAAKGE
jgi:hypothetical protein